MDGLTPLMREAVSYNKANQSSVGYEWSFIWEVLGFNHCSNPEEREFLQKLIHWQEANGLKGDGKIGPRTFQRMTLSKMSPQEKAIYEVFLCVQKYESGGRYDRLNLDGEFKGQFDEIYKKRGQPPHWASGKAHLGLSAFAIQWNQDVGTLGQVLQAMAKKNPVKFKTIVGDTWQELLDVTNRKGPRASEIIKTTKIYPIRSNRVQPVPISEGGNLRRVDLWQKPWTDVFGRLGREPEFHCVQRQEAFDEYLKRFIPFLRKNNLTSVKSVAVAFNRSVHFGQGRVESLFQPHLSLRDERKILQAVGKSYHRASEVFNDNDFGWERWSGFDLF